MSKVTGTSIKFGKAQQQRDSAKSFQNDPTIQNAVATVGLPVRTFFQNLDCAFVFDKASLQSLITIINATPDSGLIMRLGASLNEPTTDPTRINKPTLSIFACTIDTTLDVYQIIYPNPAKPAETDGTEHPGIVDLNTETIGGRGPIGFLNT